MTKSTLLLQHLLPIDAVHTGSLILDIRHPEQEFLSPPATLISPSDILTQRLQNFSYVVDQIKGTGIHAYITALFSISSKKNDASTINISSAQCITCQLKNPSMLFQQMCEGQATRAWLERAMLRKKQVYMVSGIQSLLDAQIFTSDTGESRYERSVNIPAALAATLSTGVPIPGAELLDFGAGVDASKKREEQMSFGVKEEQIFAVRYRKVAFRRYKKNEMDDVYLKLNSSWKLYLGSRGGNEAEEQFLDVDVEEVLEQEEMRWKYCGTVEMDGEEILYLA